MLLSVGGWRGRRGARGEGDLGPASREEGDIVRGPGPAGLDFLGRGPFERENPRF